jgi:hypothetical protein
VFGIGAAVTVLGMGVLLSPTTGAPPWLEVILMLLLTIVMWVALRPFRRLSQMVSSRTNHFAAASSGVSTATRSAARTSGRILTTAIGTFLGVSAAQRGGVEAEIEAQAAAGVPRRSEADTSYQPVVTVPAEGAPPAGPPAEAGVGTTAPTAPAAQPAALAGSVQINAGSVTVVGADAGSGPEVESPGEIYAPVGRSAGGRFESGNAGSGESAGAAGSANGSRPVLTGSAAAPASGYGAPAVDGQPGGTVTDRGFQPREGESPDDFDLDELNEVFRPDSVR